MIDYYKILNVKYNSSIEDIKKSYKKLVLENHPDIYPNDPIKEEHFKKISEAYETLSDSNKRKEYDKSIELEKLRNLHKKKDNSLDIWLTCTVNMKDCYNGCIKTISYNRNVRNISGNIFYETCSINVKLNPCFDNGDIIKIENGGNDSNRSDVKTGDLYIKVILIDKDYDRQDLDIFVTKHITCIDACLGTDMNICLLDGNNLTFHIPEGTQYGDSFKIKEKGLHKGETYGDMYVKIIIDIPKNLSNKDKRLLKKLRL